MPTTDNSVSRRTLVRSKSEFYVQYNANYKEVEKATAALAIAAEKLNEFKETLKEINQKAYTLIYQEIKLFLDDGLNLPLTRYELLVINPLNKFIKVLKILLNTREVALAFKVRELEEHKNLIKLIEGNLKELYEVADRTSILVNLFDSASIKKLPEKYNKLIEDLRPLIIRAREVISELTKLIDILDAKTTRILDRIA